ncbi:unnamed protein product [Medioppia subpectinata]|uniref:SCP domain-containing protein n=1 Tax=Medioppia subpectinata TaxID=1979941 RepID=A0A7R9KDT5_9ACAR|nr:unnamed protein product [Medioppia subpectinata]CAG2100282.1 unnamed protein product [Medioppia subpectinata]
MDYIHKKLTELRLIKKPSPTASTVTDPNTRRKSVNFPLLPIQRSGRRRRTSGGHDSTDADDPAIGEELDVISLPSCSTKSEEEVQSNGSSNGSSKGSISSLLGKQTLVKRSTEFRYQDAVRSATYSKSEFVLHSLQWHNILRSHHGVPPLMLSLDLCQKAQFWANHLSHTDTFYHMNDPEVGQNLLSKWSYYSEFDPTAEDICKYWYNFIDSYNFELNSNVLHTQANHFTQLIWKNSKYFGIGKARTRNGKMIVVANYMPAGNVSDQFSDNVLAPMFAELESRRNTAIIASNRKLILKSAHRLKRNRRMSPISTISTGSNINSSL